jgi:uncharacterized repeat protein (TIGR02543 family)
MKKNLFFAMILSLALVSCEKELKDFTVTFNSNEGSEVEAQIVKEGEKVTKPGDPTRDKHAFVAWYKEESLTNVWRFDNDVVNGDITLYAKWQENSYTVTFNSNSGSAVASQIVKEGEMAERPTDPELFTYIFVAWYKETELINEWNFETDIVTENKTLYAKWIADENIVAFGSSGPLKWSVCNNGILKISGQGDMPSYAFGSDVLGGSAPWFPYKNDITSIAIEEGVKSIGCWAFHEFESLTSVSLPNSFEVFSQGAFAGCINLKSINIPNSVTTIINRAFASTGLTEVYIPASVSFLDELAFMVCFSLTFIQVSENNKFYSSENGALLNKDKTQLIHYPHGNKDHFTIPGSVTTIGALAFYDSPLTSVTIPNSVITIGSEAFNSARNLTTIIIPESVKSIESFAFYNSGLTSVIIPETVTSFGEFVFSDCRNLATVNIPESWSEIPAGTFRRCGFTTITIPNSVTSIGQQAFSESLSLTSIIIPNSVTSIASLAFYFCHYLVSVTISSSQITFGDKVFAGGLGLTEVINHAVTPQGIDIYIFGRYWHNGIESVLGLDHLQGMTLRVPAVSVDVYKVTEGWKEFGNIVAL